MLFGGELAQTHQQETSSRMHVRSGDTIGSTIVVRGALHTFTRKYCGSVFMRVVLYHSYLHFSTAQGMYLDRWTKQKISNRKKRLARKVRRRARPERRRNAKASQNVARARSRTGELNVAAWNVRIYPLRDAVGPAMRRCFCRNLKCSAVTS